MSPADWIAYCDACWRERLVEMWSRPGVPLSAAIFWIASGGKPIDPEDDTLQVAAKILLEALIAGKVTATGVDCAGRAVPVAAGAFYYATRFVPRESEIDAAMDGVARLWWDCTLEDKRGDRIERNFKAEFTRIVISRIWLVSNWPARVEAGQSITIKPVKGRRPILTNCIVELMENDLRNGIDLLSLTEEAMVETYGASRYTVRKARSKSLGNAGISNSDNSRPPTISDNEKNVPVCADRPASLLEQCAKDNGDA